MRTACSLCTLHARMSHDPWRQDVHSCTPSSTSRHTSSRGTCVPCRGDAGLRGVYRASTLSQTRAESLSTRHFAVETSCFMLDSRSRPHRDVGGVTVDARSRSKRSDSCASEDDGTYSRHAQLGVGVGVALVRRRTAGLVCKSAPGSQGFHLHRTLIPTTSAKGLYPVIR